jgi:hypothetical protein
MAEIKWEQIQQDHGDYLYRAKVPGGWLVKNTNDVLTTRSDPNDHRYPYEENLEYRSSICFIPDPNNEWK